MLIKGKQNKTDNTAHQIPNRDRLAVVPQQMAAVDHQAQGCCYQCMSTDPPGCH